MKSKFKLFITVIITLIILMAALTAAYAFNGTFRNSVDLLLKSPRDYYVHLEYKSIEAMVDKFVDYSKSNTNENAAQYTAYLTYDKDTVNALLKNSSGMTISDIEALTGIPLNSLGYDLISAVKKDKLYQKLDLYLNDTYIISGEFFTDYAIKEFLFHFPDLSPAYVRRSLDINTGDMKEYYFDVSGAITNKLSSDDIGEFIKHYAKLITDGIDDVQLTKNEKLTVGDLTVDTNLLTVYLYPEALKNITVGILEEMIDDEFILDLLPEDITEENFTEKADKAIKDCQTHFDSLPQDKELVLMKVYVGKDGRILGRSFEIKDGSDYTVNINFLSVKQNNKGAYDYYIENYDKTTLQLSGSHYINDKAYTGSATLKIVTKGPDNMESVEFEIEYEDIKYELMNNNICLFGNISLSSSEMMGMEILIEMDTKDDARLTTLKLNMGKTSLITIETTAKYIEDFSIPGKKYNAKTFDISEIDEYATTIDWDEFISALSDRLGVDLEELLGNLLTIYR
ncbi:MAG TPA: hypothetical protein GX002_00350 [Clostridiales bacterium]|nr:hypothetical protein [Clostridiales bacterium]